MKKITLYNDFHNTEINLIPRNGMLSANQVKKAKRSLCGVHGCTCSDYLGCRGPQDVEYAVVVNRTTQIKITGAKILEPVKYSEFGKNLKEKFLEESFWSVEKDDGEIICALENPTISGNLATSKAARIYEDSAEIVTLKWDFSFSNNSDFDDPDNFPEFDGDRMYDLDNEDDIVSLGHNLGM